ESTLPEVAFVGRSNVGKSSLINSLSRQRSLARTSGTPGKTQTINFYELTAKLNETERKPFHLVDLPGYGYAKTGQQNRKTWSNFIREYLMKSPNLRLICQLIDVRHTPMKSDFETFAWLAENDLPVLLIATKCDKLSRNELEKQARIITKAFGVERENLLCYSSVTHAGRADLLDVIYENLLQ
ncbi:MAG: YihA family ribosome biogenesis GTP-binding protein, partial [Christensenellaceae bacterium]|nr:YihA family ribosome biogenesis GTP-binding protein [Christensenellaceae bacterium]